MHTWFIDPRASRDSPDLQRAAALVAALGATEERPFAQAVLGLFDDLPAIAQCTVFAYEAGRPRTLSVGDYRGGPYLRAVADTYTRRFHTLDGIQPILAAPPTPAACSATSAAAPPPLLHQQSSADIAHETYRHVCYLRPSVRERLTLLAPLPGQVWLSVNLYRHALDGAGGFLPGEIARVEAAAPLVAHAVARHYALCKLRPPEGAPDNAPGGAPLAARLRRLFPELSPREHAVLCGLLGGLATGEIARRIGVQPSSVISYQKRAYRRLGISGQRQLFALVNKAG